MNQEPNDTRVAGGALIRGEASAGPRLVIRNGPDAGRAHELGRSLTVGRAREADLRISDPAASRLHARLSIVDGRVVATDLRSKNGLRVNGERCRASRPLELGDELAIGATCLTLEPGLLDATKPGAAASGGASPLPPEGSAPVPAWTWTWTAVALLAAAAALIAAALLLAL